MPDDPPAPSVTDGTTGPLETQRAVSGRHLPALDGVRALAILGVMAYHLGFGWASGGYLGVDLFFVLSGFLITSLLVEERCTTGRIRLGSFWGRRARRLLPALFIVLVAVSVYAVLNGRFSSPTTGGAAIDLGALRGDTLATLLYVANWHAVIAHQSYFAQFSTPSPLQHTWSLAIEEQFYLVWPLAVVGLFLWAKRRWRTVGLGLCLVGAVASAVAMAVLFHPGGDPTRVYYGTDTRAFDLLVGAAVAFLAASRPQPGRRARTLLHAGALPAAGALAYFWVTAGTTSGTPTDTMFRGGFLLCAVLAAVVIADARQFDQGPLAKALSIRPVRWIGTVSYGLYLWHWPVFVYFTQSRTGLSGFSLDAGRIATTFAFATTSYYLLELPIRRRRLLRTSWKALAPGAAVLTVLAIVVGTTPSIAEPALGAGLRIWNGGLYPGSGPSVIGAGGFAGEQPIRLPKGMVVDKAHPLRVVTFGDSIMSGAQHGIEAALDSTGVVVVGGAAVPGWGLDRPTVKADIPGLVRTFRPQILVGTWSWDAPAARANPAGYEAMLDQAVRQMLTPGDGVIGVVFLQMPALGPLPPFIEATPDNAAFWEERVAGIPAWNRAVQEAAASFPGQVMYLPVASSLEIDGQYTNWLPPRDDWSAPPSQWVRVRTSDAVHLCPAGISRYAAPVLQDLSTLFGLPAPKEPWWRSRRITVDGFDNDPSVALTCPDDHPHKVDRTP